MIVEFNGYFDVDDGNEEKAKDIIEQLFFELPFFIDVEFQ